MINQNFPEIEVHGDNYPPPPLKQYLSSALSMFKMAFILCVVSGYNVFELLGMPAPQFMNWAWENKVCTSLFLFSFTDYGIRYIRRSFESYLSELTKHANHTMHQKLPYKKKTKQSMVMPLVSCF